MRMMRNMNVFHDYMKNVNQLLMLMINGFHIGMNLLHLRFVFMQFFVDNFRF
jgi:hypothetical protein